MTFVNDSFSSNWATKEESHALIHNRVIENIFV